MGSKVGTDDDAVEQKNKRKKRPEGMLIFLVE